jgi:hypothetical protein
MQAVIRITQSRFCISCCDYIFRQQVIWEVVTAKDKRTDSHTIEIANEIK